MLRNFYTKRINKALFQLHDGRSQREAFIRMSDFCEALEIATRYRLEFQIAELPRTTNAQNSMHWTAKARYVKHWHSLVRAAAGKLKPKKPLKTATLTLTRFSSCEPDFDGLVSSFKHVIDGLVVCGVLENDKFSNIGRSGYFWIKSSPKKGFIEVSVSEFLQDQTSSALLGGTFENSEAMAGIGCKKDIFDPESS